MRRVLVVDDDDCLRAVVCTVLRRAGFWVEEAVVPSEAVRAARLVPPNVVVLDNDFGRSITGRDIAPVLKAVAPQCRVLIHSGCDFALPIAGVDAAALKPVPPADLVAAVRGLLRQGATASSRS